MAFDFLLPDGYFRSVGQNEVELVSTAEDPPKVRMGAVSGKGLGALSFNRVRASDGRNEEHVLLQGKEDDRVGMLGRAAGSMTLHLKRPDMTGDAAMAPVYEAYHDRVEFKVPITAPGLGGGGVPPQLVSPNGRFLLNMQDDGNLVKYELVNGVWVDRWATGV